MRQKIIKNFWKELKRPIKVLAPMAGYTDAAFRLLAREYGADVVVTELISADAIAHTKLKVERQKLKVTHWFHPERSAKSGDSKDLVFNRVVGTKSQSTAELLSFFELERPLVVQLFGKYPEKFGLAAKWITENLKVDGIDINMGCPARKVVGSDHGAALIKYPKLAAEIVRAVRENTNLPVSVKTRLGWDDPETILEFAPLLQKAGLSAGQAGIDAIIIHGRTYKQGFKGEADWTNVYKIKEMLPELIVIGNGDIGKISNSEFLILASPAGRSNQIPNSKSQFQKLPLDGVAVGRAAFGKPWIFSGRELNTSELKKLILHHAELVVVAKGEYGIIEFRKHLLKYLSGFDGARELRKQAVSIKNIKDIRNLLVNLDTST